MSSSSWIVDALKDRVVQGVCVGKAVRLGVTFLSLYLAGKIFLPVYEAAVYEKGHRPPSLLGYVILFAALDLVLNLALLAVLWTAMIAFGTPTNGFAVDQRLMFALVTDYVVHWVVLVTTSVFLAATVKNDAYFRYRYEGSRAVRGLGDMILSTAAVTTLIPYCLFFWGIAPAAKK